MNMNMYMKTYLLVFSPMPNIINPVVGRSGWGRQTLVFLQWLEFPLSNRHQTLWVGTSYQDASEVCF